MGSSPISSTRVSKIVLVGRAGTNAVPRGLEPWTFKLLSFRSNQLSDETIEAPKIQIIASASPFDNSKFESLNVQLLSIQLNLSY